MPTEATIQRSAQMAIDCQNACNLSGVAHSLAKACSSLWDEAHRNGHGTDWVNTHPIVKLFVAQLAHLSKFDDGTYVKAYDECERLASHP